MVESVTAPGEGGVGSTGGRVTPEGNGTIGTVVDPPAVGVGTVPVDGAGYTSVVVGSDAGAAEGALIFAVPPHALRPHALATKMAPMAMSLPVRLGTLTSLSMCSCLPHRELIADRGIRSGPHLEPQPQSPNDLRTHQER